MSERVEALRLIEEDPSASIEAVLAALEDDASEVRAQAASSVVAARESRVASNLLDLAGARETAEREAAIRALGRSGSARAQPTLERALQDDAPAVSIAAAEALASFVGRGAFDSAKVAGLLNASDPLQRVAAVELLDASKDPAGLAARGALLRKAARDKAPEVRSAALRALGHMRDARWLVDLQAGLSDADESVRLWAISALGDSGLAAAVSALRGGASGPDVRAAETALAALGRIDDAGTVAAIAPQLTRAPLARAATDALVARARRLRSEAALRESGDAVRRAIDGAREVDVLDVLAEAVVELARTAAAGSGRGQTEQQTPGAAPLAAAQRSLAQALASGRGNVGTLAQSLITLREPGVLPALLARHEQNASATPPAAAALHTRALLAAAPSTAQPDARPTTARRDASPTTTQTNARPTTARRDASPTTAQTNARPTTARRDASPTTAQTNARPTTAPPDARPTIAPPDASPTTAQPDARPTTAQRESSHAGAQPRAATSSASSTRRGGPAAAADERAELLRAVVASVLAGEDAAALLTTHSALLEQLAEQPEAPPSAATSLVQLRSLLDLDTSDAERAPEARRALAELWAEPAVPKAPKHAERLLAWLSDPDQRVREQASIALARTAGPAELAALATRLEQHAPYPELSLQACAGALLRADATLPPPLRERLLQQLKSHLEQPDEAVAMSALFALRASRDPRAGRWIAALLRGTSLPLRAAALQALGDFDEQDARRLLRDTLRGDNVASASSAALGLAELGSDRDVEALLRAAERGSWPLQPSAAYAAARIIERAHTRKHSLERNLCRFAQQRDSYAVANSASALAALGASACSEPQLDPTTLLQSSLPSALRVAAATWLRAANKANAAEPTQRSELLASCAEDPDPAVARACSQPDTHQDPDVSGQTLLELYDDDRTPLRGRIVALRLPNASIYIGRSDSAGRLLLPRTVRGEIVLEDPANSANVSPLPAESADNSPARSK